MTSGSSDPPIFEAVFGVITLGGLAAAGVGALVGAAIGSSEADEWTRRLREIAEAVDEYDAATILRDRLAQRLTFGGDVWLGNGTADEPVPTDAAKASVEVVRFQIRETRNNYFFIEIALRLRITKPGDSRPAFDRIYLSTHTRAKERSFLADAAIPAEAMLLHPNALKHEDAPQTVVTQIDYAIETLCDAIAADLRQAVE